MLLKSRILPALLAAFFSPAAAQANLCVDVPVQINSQDRVLSDEVCAAASAALRFLSQYGVVPASPIVIDVVEAPLEHYGYRALGSFDAGTGRISLMSQQAIDRLDPVPAMYGLPFDRIHYRGAVAHEVAHAAFHQNSPNAQLANTAQEYLAHVTQMAVLPPELRVRVIERAAVSAWESGDTISEIYMALAPEKFAVKSWLHFSQLDDPTAFVDMLLNIKWFYVHVP